MHQFKVIFLLFLIAVGLACCAQHRVQGNGDVIKKTVKLAHFEHLKLVGQFQVSIHTGRKQQLQLQGDSNILPLVQFRQNQGTLTVMLSPAVTVSSRHRIRLYLTVRQMHQLDLTGSNHVVVKQLKGERLIVNNDGASFVRVSGKVNDLDVNMAGTGQVKMQHLTAADCELNIAGAGKATVFATRQLTVNVSGVAQVRYYGHPRLHTNVSGSASVLAAA